jgi:hypothetical protein
MMKQIKEQPKGRATAKADSGDKRMFPKINGYIRLHSGKILYIRDIIQTK